METSGKIAFRAGLFVTLGIFICVGSILMLGDKNVLWSNSKVFSVELPDVQGLNSGSVVSLSGVVVGNIKNVSISDKGAILVQFFVDKVSSQRITSSSRVSLRTQGALGDKYIYVTMGAPGEEPLKEKSVLQVDTESGLIETLQTRGGEIARVFDAIEEFHRLFASVNEKNRPRVIMDNLMTSTQKLERTLESIQRSAGNFSSLTDNKGEIKKSAEHLHSILAKIDKGEGTLGKLINDPSLYNRLRQMLGETQQGILKPLVRDSIRAPTGK